MPATIPSMANGLIHECPPGCRGCFENQQELLQTLEGRDVLHDRYARAINTPQALGSVRACTRVRNGNILALGENIGNSTIGAVADGNFLTDDTFEVAIYKTPAAQNIRGVATTALDRLSEKVAKAARGTRQDRLTLVAQIDRNNLPSIHFFRQRGFSLEDPDAYSGYYTYTKKVDL